MKRWTRYLPLAALILFVIAVDWRLSNPPSTVIESRLVGQPFPALGLPAVDASHPTLAEGPGAPKGARVVNLFASWCLPCIGEAPVLMELKRRGVTIDGIAVRDKPERVAAFLKNHGDPFRFIGADLNSGGQLQLGSSGVPETFVVDGQGIIRRHYVGPIERRDLDDIIAAMGPSR
ncbi:redoxin family protein [Sphingomonas rhizophila]|uniref:Redoxin family protein n=1 Tax=Sphingomonas rhizophila TaxID=2071607 RepID=A0A7G9SD51_9SPHN|nr:redoxin family protein [Sphingomonas rhizophila]QNN65776.1 redoxin family protein [Sphingomonas rhizophila]